MKELPVVAAVRTLCWHLVCLLFWLAVLVFLVRCVGRMLT